MRARGLPWDFMTDHRNKREGVRGMKMGPVSQVAPIVQTHKIG